MSLVFLKLKKLLGNNELKTYNLATCFLHFRFKGAHDGEFMAGLRDQESLRFLLTLSNRDPNVRNQAFDAIRQNIDLWISGSYGSPVPPLNSSEISDFQNDLDIKLSKVQERLPDFLRMIYSCPFRDISEKCQWFLEDLQVCRFWFLNVCKIPLIELFSPEYNGLFRLLT